MPKITVIGNLTGDPELRFTPNGAAVVKFTVAENERILDRQTQEWKDGDSIFYRVESWRDSAEHIAESLERGARVVVVGDLKNREYEKDGVKRYSLEIHNAEVGASLKHATAKVTKSSKGNGGGSRPAGRNSAPAGDGDPWGAPAGASSAPANAGNTSFDDEPPF